MEVTGACLCRRLALLWLWVTCAQGANPLARRHEKVCPGMDLRNHVDQFEELRNCTVIEGSLHIVLIEHAVASEFESLSFPRLREITDYLLLYRVYGLKSLSGLFPNLNVIRGQRLFYDYALVLFEVPDIEYIGLYGLSAIVRGAVRLEKNQNLCYVETIDWSRIIAKDAVDNFITENKPIDQCVNECPKDCDNKDLCWTEEHCQKLCPTECGDRACYVRGGRKHCCHDQCLGGCVGPTDADCYACRSIFHNNRCQKDCPADTYEFQQRRCITEHECRDLSDVEEEEWKLLDNGKCEMDCPSGYTKPKDSDDHNVCVPCDGPCPKVCAGLVVENVAAAQKLRGCTEIHGILEIMIRGGNLVGQELQKSLGQIEEVTSYVKIVRSSALVSLQFLKNLRLIRGERLQKDSYALFVLDNDNLQDIWDFNTHPALTIGNGKVLFQFNRKLCLNKIKQFVKMVGLEGQVTHNDVSETNNGDLIACNMTQIDIKVLKIDSEIAIIKWTNYYTNDARELLNWVVNYREAPFQNVSMFDARDACGPSLWRTNDVNAETPQEEETELAHILFQLKPNTQYAVYVQTYTVSSAKQGALSPIIYFTTAADVPSNPRDLDAVAPRLGELKVTWEAPRSPNGNVTHYYVRWQAHSQNVEKFAVRDYCVDPLQSNAKKDAEEARKEAENRAQEENNSENTNNTEGNHGSSGSKKNQTMIPEDQCCTCSKTDEERKEEEEERHFQIEFENYLQDTLYHPRVTPGKSINIDTDVLRATYKKKRSISDWDMDELLRTSTASLIPDEAVRGRNAKRGPISDDYGRRRRSPDSQYTNYTLLMNSTSFNYTLPNNTYDKPVPDEITYDYVEVYNKQEVLLTQMKYFTEYSIEVIACHDYSRAIDKKRCSQRAITSARTLPFPEADLIDVQNVTAANNTYENGSSYIQLRWDEPPSPNGLILTYDVEVTRSVSADVKPTMYCLTHKRYKELGGYNLLGLSHGHYTFRLRATSLAGAAEWSHYMRFYVPNTEEPPKLGMWFIFLTVFIAVMIITVILLIAFFYVKRKSNHIPDQPLYTSVNPDYVGFTEVYVPDEWEVEADKVELVKEIGQGSFGKVYEGIANDIAQEDMEEEFHGRIRVAVKTVFENASVRDRVEFLNEASVMKAFRSYHVLRLLGVVSKRQPTYVIMEYMANGDLKTFLRMHRPDYEEGNRRQPPTLQQILQMAGEIADGMAYLAYKKFVHRDLAARNCMVSENLVVKIGDFGMTRDIYDTDYYRKSGKGCLPVRWMAPESLRDGTYTSQSDVWSYGVVIWEMATLATQPYQGLSNEEVLKYVINKQLMEIPENCPPQLSKLMLQCWEYLHRNRPNFAQIIEYLEPELSDAFVERSFFHNTEEPEAHMKLENEGSGEDEVEICVDADWDDGDYRDYGSDDDDDVGTPLNGTPRRAPAESTSLSRSSLSYDSPKSSPSGTPNQNSFFSTDFAAHPASRPFLPERMTGSRSSGYSSSPANRTAAPPPYDYTQRDPTVLKETMHLWQRPPSPSHKHSTGPAASSQKGNMDDSGDGGGDERPLGQGTESRDSSKSSAGSNGRNGITNGHIPHMVSGAQC